MNKQRGFTITELLVAVAVGSIASVLIVSAFVFTYGDVVVEQTRSAMVRQSQLFLRRMVEDIRVSSQIRATNTITDSHQVGGWVTSDPANILIVTVPATDESNNLMYDPLTGYPYYHEVVYFGQNGTMYRRLLANPAATGTAQTSTCPDGVVGCLPDIELVDNLDNMVFEFFDVNDTVTTVPADARSVEITVNLRRKVYGQELTTTNTTRVTLRNEI